MTRIFFLFTALLAGQCTAVAGEKFAVVVHRERTRDGLVVGVLSVNGEPIGTCYENAEKKIPAGTYRGVLRYRSSHSFVQNPGGVLRKSGDFLLEVAGVPHRTDILFHPGNQAAHSKGCFLGGPATSDQETGERIAPEPLRTLRLKFYGTDTPTATPDKDITIEVRDPR